MKGSELPNIILIIMDSVAAKWCSAYGHVRQTTPGLERLAGEGVLYQHCFAPASWTLPSHTSLFTGLYPGQHLCNNPQEFAYPGNYHTLPEILRQAGYRTIGISSNYAISRGCNFNFGFDEYYDMDTLFNCDRYSQMRQFLKSSRNHIHSDLQEIKLIFRTSMENRYYSYPFKHLLDRIYRKLCGDVIIKSRYATERALCLCKRLIKKYRGSPFFIFINFMETHAAYNPPRRYRTRWVEDLNGATPTQLLYEQEIAYLDDRLFHLYSFLGRTGLKDRTLWAVTADHGEGFGEHGVFSHNFSVYNELIHIPLIVKYPKDLGLTGESDQVVQLHDLFSTILELADVPLPAPESSQSLLGPPRDFALVENLDTLRLAHLKLGPDFQPRDFMQPCLALVDTGLHKLITWADGHRELYDLKRDYGEAANLIDHPEYQRRAASLQQTLAEVAAPFPDRRISCP